MHSCAFFVLLVGTAFAVKPNRHSVALLQEAEATLWRSKLLGGNTGETCNISGYCSVKDSYCQDFPKQCTDKRNVEAVKAFLRKKNGDSKREKPDEYEPESFENAPMDTRKDLCEEDGGNWIDDPRVTITDSGTGSKVQKMVCMCPRAKPCSPLVRQYTDQTQLVKGYVWGTRKKRVGVFSSKFHSKCYGIKKEDGTCPSKVDEADELERAGLLE
uniref:Uncharacterized protein n=1 Tax=Chromera velia CCMP2878 TaxID=1169474 RepID=A0A0G4HM00_9ALVE|eukprot:Cvel_28952.t1-p1 / transcript=Cvel_28952.t1 / gene=Cvel_28952 / organism=Chromera_velia_CCMP2878 / gene_product=hypothetical protein / transcript_product=hypothetical protein / location=Cvel_scaffold3884:2895-7153(+) / protein_length=214 / sequence_SO=supercontig / SO=protein_coding / is_pseudo=false